MILVHCLLFATALNSIEKYNNEIYIRKYANIYTFFVEDDFQKKGEALKIEHGREKNQQNKAFIQIYVFAYQQNLKNEMPLKTISTIKFLSKREKKCVKKPQKLYGKTTKKNLIIFAFVSMPCSSSVL